MAALVLLSVMLSCVDELRASEPISKPDALSSEAMAGMPELVVPEAEFNFEEVSEGADYVHDFAILNVGAGILKIKRVIPG